MLSNTFVLFIVTVFIASIIPGPSMFLALSHGLRFGMKKTLFSASGNALVTFCQALISFLGLGVVLATSTFAFQLIKWAGAVYLIFMGVGFIRSAKAQGFESNHALPNAAVSGRTLFTQSAIVTAANPKALIFFTAIFPQFVNPDKTFMAQAILLTTTCTFIGFICFLIYAALGQKLMGWFASANIKLWLQRAFGTTFIGSGVALAFSNR